MDNLKNLYEVQDLLSRELEEAVKKAQSSGSGKMTGSDLDYLDKLTHAMKSVKTTIAMCEAEEDGNSYSMMGGIEPGRGSRQAYRAYAYDGSYNMSGRRGRSPSTGRFVSRAGGYSGHDAEYMDLLQDAMEKAPDEASRRKLEQMMQQM